MKNLFIFLFLLSFMCSCQKATDEKDFVRVNNGQFEINGKPYRYIGTNFWYGAILGSKGQGGNRDRLTKELDFLKMNGIDNLRVLVGADGKNGVKSKIEPTLQIAPGVYNDTIFDGLDFLLVEMGKRKMYAVLYLNNSWEWSGGYSQYLEWAGYGKAPIPAVDGWDVFQTYVGGYVKSEKAKGLFYEHVKHVIGRTNRYSKKSYKEDSTIMAWQIGNEPRAFGEANKVAYAEFIKTTASLIKSIDANHLLSVGSEGSAGTEGDINLWKEIHSNATIDYTTIHTWPYNWGWIDSKDLAGTYQKATENVKEYIQKHVVIAEGLKKPIVLEEFGFPRDNMSCTAGSSVKYRDLFFDEIFKLIDASAKSKGVLAGCNIWAWGGFGRPANRAANSTEKDDFWKVGDDYLGDPAQEPQGLNSIFDVDSTMKIIGKYKF